MVLLGIIMVIMNPGKPTVIVALALYSLLPIVRNTCLGLDQVPEHLIEAGKGMGMTRMYRLIHVEIPIAAPIIFTGIYAFNRGETGLAFLPIGVGAFISAIMYLTWDTILARAQRQQRPWAKVEEMRRLPLACIAGPFFVVSAFWLGWSARESVHWIGMCICTTCM